MYMYLNIIYIAITKYIKPYVHIPKYTYNYVPVPAITKYITPHVHVPK